MANPSPTRKGFVHDWAAGIHALVYTGAQSGAVAHGANTALTGILLGTPVTPALAVDSVVISGLVASGDFLLALNRAGNSENYVWADSSAGTLTLYAPNGALTLTPTSDVVISDGTGLLIGSATAVTVSDGDGATNLIPELQVLGTGVADGSALAAVFNTTNTRAVAPRFALVKGAAATQVATTAVADNEVVGVLIAYASDSADFETPVGSIEFVVDDPGAPGAGAIGGSIEFYTTADGGETLTLAATVNTAQNVIVSAAVTSLTISDGDGATNLIPHLQVVGTTAALGTVAVASFNTTNTRAVAPILALVKGAAATQVATTAVADNEVIGSIIGYGSDSADFETAVASIQFVVDDVGGPGAGAIGGSLEFYTTADGGETLTLSYTVATDQNIFVADANGVVIGHTAQVATNGQTNEFQIIGTSAPDAQMSIQRWTADAVGPRLHFAKSRVTTIGTFGIITTGDVLGEIMAFGDDGVDFNSNGNASAAIRFASSGTLAADRVPGEISFYTATDAAPSVLTIRATLDNAGIFGLAAGTSVRANSATEIAISVTNDAIVVGTEGTMIAPYLSQTGAAFTDAIGGDVNGAFGFNNDSDTGPTRTLEVRAEGSWLSVAVTGYLHQNRIPWVEKSTFLYHPDQLVREDGKWWLDESLCFVCGEPMVPGDQLTFWANGRYERGTHSIFGHTHLERDEVVKALTERVGALETELARERERELVPA